MWCHCSTWCSTIPSKTPPRPRPNSTPAETGNAPAPRPAAPLTRSALLGLEAHRPAVHAVALAGGLRPVREDVAEVPAAARAMHLRARHEQAAVGLGADPALDGRPEGRPAGAALELGAGVEQRLAAAGAQESAGADFGGGRAGDA